MFFFDIGVERQLNSTTETEANRNFSISCKICCGRGYHMDCEKCPIASANEQQKAAILDARKVERQQRQKKYEEKKAVEEMIKSAAEIYAKILCPRDFEKYGDDLEKLTDLFLKMKA